MSTRSIAHPSSAPSTDEGWEKIYNDIQHGLVAAVAQVEAEWARAPIDAHDSIYTGLTGLAMMQYHIAARLQTPKLEYLAKRIEVKLDNMPREMGSPLDADRLRREGDMNLCEVLGHLARRGDGDGGGGGSQWRMLRNVDDAAHASFLETSVGLATLVLVRCIAGDQKISPASEGRGETGEDDDTARAGRRPIELLKKYWHEGVAMIRDAVQRVDDEDDAGGWEGEDGGGDGGSEVLYGRAGLLYALLFLRKAVSSEKAECSIAHESGPVDSRMRKDVEELTSNASMRVVIDALVRRGRKGAKRYSRGVGPGQAKTPALMWRWHGATYLGAAHGACGILQMLLTCPRPTIESHLTDILQTIEWIVSVQDAEGNWPAKVKSRNEGRPHSSRNNELVQWCHGAPGVLILLATVLNRCSAGYNYYRLSDDFQNSIRASLRRGADLVYERGLLTKGLGLCHGVAGSVYSLTAASGALDTETCTTYMKKAVHLSHLALLAGQLTKDGSMCVPDRPWSLYEGVAGMCCAWVDVLSRLAVDSEMRVGTASGMPAFDDILV